MTNKKNGTSANIREVYQLVSEMRKELSDSISRLENKFDALEAGRLTSLENRFANLQGKMSIVAGVVSFLVSLFFVIVNIYLK